MSTGAWGSSARPSPDGPADPASGRSAQPGSSVLPARLRRGTSLIDPVFSPDGSTVAVGQESKDRQIPELQLLLWDWRSDTTDVWEVGTGSGPVYSPDGTRLALRDNAGPAQVWDVDTGQQLFILDGHTAGVGDVTYSPDGRLIATASFDGTARLWDAENGDAVLRLPGLAGEVSSVDFSPDGDHLATHSLAEGMVRVWTLDPDELMTIASQNVTRGFTTAECQEYLQAQTCP